MSNLPIAKQMSILRKIWGGNSEGYVFLPWIPGDRNTKEERTARDAWKEVGFKWPEDEEMILKHLSIHENDDLFFCPNLFETEHRSVQTVAWNQRVLYADLDEVDPRLIEDEYKPTMAWETSNGSFQAVWILGRDGIGLSDEGAENHRLTVYLGADKTGWDCTQLLRVPGRVNHKQEKYGQQGVLLWDNGPRYNDAEDFADLPEIKVVTADVADIDDAILDSIDRKAAWRRLRMKVSTRCRDYMTIRDERTAKDAAEALGEGMSGLLWYVERELADAGATVAEIVAIVRPMAWNKFAGRADELVRLKSEAAKAVAQTNENDSSAALEESVSDLGDVSVSLDDFMSESRPRPSWLVDKVWARGTVGFIAGAPKSYKSWVALDLAMSVATGTKFLGAFDVNGGAQRVLYIQEEDSDIQVLDRMDKIFWGKDREIHPHGYMDIEVDGRGRRAVVWKPSEGQRLMRLIVRKGLDLTSVEWQGLLAEQCEEYAYDLIIIDTLGTSAGDTDTDKSREVNKALKPLKVLAEQYSCAIAVVHHFSKAGASGTNGSSRGGHKMLGSVALHAWVETALYVSEKTEVRDKVYRVEIERESKSAQDMRFGLEVPLMGHMLADESGVMVGTPGWNPQVDKRGRASDPDDKGSERERPSGGRGKTRAGVHAWEKTVRKMVGGGATKKERALTATQIRDRLFGDTISRQAIDAQMRQAIQAGQVEKIDGGAYFVVRATEQ